MAELGILWDGGERMGRGWGILILLVGFTVSLLLLVPVSAATAVSLATTTPVSPVSVTASGAMSTRSKEDSMMHTQQTIYITNLSYSSLFSNKCKLEVHNVQVYSTSCNNVALPYNISCLETLQEISSLKKKLETTILSQLIYTCTYMFILVHMKINQLSGKNVIYTQGLTSRLNNIKFKSSR